MFSYFKKSKKQKELYFQLDKEFKKSIYDEKLSGIYAIFKYDICLYVGQSKNIPSRIATHLSGKYQECSKILIFPTIDPEEDLIALEKFVMQQLKPTENLLVDFTEEINHEDFAEGSIVYYFDYCDCNNEVFNILKANEFTLVNSKFDLLVSHEINIDLYADEGLFNFLAQEMREVLKEKGR